MKLNGFVGKGSGKLGASVFAISGGEQIVRQYNPQVANPNTAAQVAQRAKLKLMSQIAAALAPALAFKKQGLVSARNQFVSKNIGLVDVDMALGDEMATVDYTKLQITGGSIVIPSPSYGQGQGSGMVVKLAAAAPTGVARVVYVHVKNTSSDKLSVEEIVVASTPGSDGKFQANLVSSAEEGVLFAYGIMDKDAGATAKFDNYEASGADHMVNLSIFLTQNSASYALTASSAIGL